MENPGLVHLKIDRGLGFSFESGLGSSLMSCLVYCVHIHHMFKYCEMLLTVDKCLINNIVSREYLNINPCRIQGTFLIDELCTDVSKLWL